LLLSSGLTCRSIPVFARQTPTIGPLRIYAQAYAVSSTLTYHARPDTTSDNSDQPVLYAHPGSIN